MEASGKRSLELPTNMCIVCKVGGGSPSSTTYLVNGIPTCHNFLVHAYLHTVCPCIIHLLIVRTPLYSLGAFLDTGGLRYLEIHPKNFAGYSKQAFLLYHDVMTCCINTT